MEKKLHFSKKSLPYVFLSPAVILIALFLFYPMIRVIFYSFFQFNLAKPWADKFIFLGNYVEIFTNDKIFYKVLLVTLQWVAATVSVQLLLGLIFANVLNQEFHNRGFFRAVSFLPWAVSGIVTSMLWSLIYDEHMGLLNTILLRVGFISKGIPWVASTNTVFGAVVAAEIWRGAPFFIIILLAALQNIPESIYDACKVDGAGRGTTFFFITLPYLKETIIFGTILRAVWEFNNVDVIFSITGGGPAHKTTTLTMYIINQAIKTNNFGYGAALTVIGSILMLFFIIVYMKLMRYSDEGI